MARPLSHHLSDLQRWWRRCGVKVNFGVGWFRVLGSRSEVGVLHGVEAIDWISQAPC